MGSQQLQAPWLWYSGVSIILENRRVTGFESQPNWCLPVMHLPKGARRMSRFTEAGCSKEVPDKCPSLLHYRLHPVWFCGSCKATRTNHRGKRM